MVSWQPGLTVASALALSLSVAGCSDSKKAPKQSAATSDAAIHKTKASKKGKVVQKLSLDERRRRLLAAASPELRKQMLGGNKPKLKVDKADIRQLSPGVVMVGNIKVFVKERRFEVPGKVTLRPGEIIEYLAVAPQGKTHETVFTLNTSSVHFRLALTMAGVMPASVTKGKTAPVTPQTSVGIAVRVSDKPGAKEIPATAFTVNRATGKPLAHKAWQMAGFERKWEVAALQNHQLVATRYDPIALVNSTKDTGNPYAGKKIGLAVSKKVPAVGTKVTLVFRSLARKKPKDAASKTPSKK